MGKISARWIGDVSAPINLVDEGVINLLSVLAANVDYCGITTLIDVDDTSAAFGNPLYVASDGNCDRCDASAISTMPCRFIAIDVGGGSNQRVLLEGYMRNTSWSWTVGGEIYVSESVGGLTQSAPTTASAVVQSIGFAVTSDIIAVRIGPYAELSS